MQKIRRLNVSPSVFFLFLAILISGYLRLARVLQSPMPIGDGGMFYSMTLDLINNRFHLPETISYNRIDLPNTYPPLGFYLAGALSVIFHINLLDIFRFLPVFFSILSIPAFYFLAKELVKNEVQLTIATLIFSLVPPTFDWLIKGGGVTRSPSFVFSLLALAFAYRLFTQEKVINLALTSIFCAITYLFHPQIAFYTVASTIVFFFFLQRNRNGLKKGLITAGLTLILISPWLVPTLIKHGFMPFISALTTGEYSILSTYRLIFGNTLKEIGLTSIGVFALVGVFWYLHDEGWFFAIWALMSLFIDPRSSPRNLSIIAPICASYALIKIFGRFKYSKNETQSDPSSQFTSKLAGVLLIILFCQWLFSSWFTLNILEEEYSMKDEDLLALQWIKENTPLDSEFLVLTGLAPFDDSFSEWFPALTNRVSLATVQGKEWDMKQDFNGILNAYEEAQSCFDKSEKCIADWEKNHGVTSDYVFVRLENSTQGKDISYPSALSRALIESEQYEQVYANDLLEILRKR